MFEITKEDIESLNDTDLRTLIGRLCEADLYALGDSTRHVSYGGNQDEKDGGIDVKVDATKIVGNSSFILKNNTIFQVKKPSMTPSKIKSEMKNKDGSLKECILNLSKCNGAYIIVSSEDDLTELTYQSRIKSMKEALAEFEVNNIEVEFYDCGKVASWVRNYPSLVCWVNDKNKKNTNGWTSYCNWSSRNFEELPFIMDNNSVIFKNDFSKDSKIPLLDGINEIRNTLLGIKNSVRLAGLSGVGKTRLTQALFDDSIGENPLNKEMVIYGDVGDSLFPDPITFIQQLQKEDKRIILIVDNCEATMHNKLTEICQRENSNISLMTIEYDVKEDDNVDSNNYYLSSTSEDVLKQLIKRDFSDISDINIDTIVNCSEGNFRIAIYLAKSIFKQKNIGVLKYDELFSRLFYQGGKVDDKLLKVGEVCSLFYSFDISYDSAEEKNELNIIAGLVSMNALDVFGMVEELKQRQIVQKRGNMRAVLPHALANKLAIDFLKKYPCNQIIEVISKNSRLCLSFFRRLKFLHLSSEAQFIAKTFFKTLSDTDFINANGQLIEKIRCVMILNPEMILKRLESIDESLFFARENKNFYEIVNMLSYIAFDKDLFKRSVELIIRFVLSEREGENYNSTRNILYNLFHAYLSFTHAPLVTRLEIISDLLKDTDNNKKILGIRLVNEILEYGNFVGGPIFDCGSQIRDYGLEPNLSDWYKEGINYCKKLLAKDICYKEVKDIIANNFRNLASIGFYNELEDLVESELDKRSWPAIWISLLAIKHFDSEKISPKLMKRIDMLLERVKPLSIPDKIKVFFAKGRGIYINVDDTTENEKELNDKLYNLGKDIALDKNHINEYILLLDDTCALYRISFFAKGLYDNFDNKEELIYTNLDSINDNNKIIVKEIVSSLINFYHEENPELCANLLDKLLETEKYSIYYTYFQMSYELTESDVIRVKRAISLGKFNELDINQLDWSIKTLSTEQIIDLLDLIPKNIIANNNILMALLRLGELRKEDKLLKKYVRTFLANLNYEELNEQNTTINYLISELIEFSFSIERGNEEAIIIFSKINGLIEVKCLSFYSYKYVLEPLIKLYPLSFLDVFVDYNGEPSWKKKNFFLRAFSLNHNILLYINDEIVIDWMIRTDKVLELSYLVEPYVFDEEKNIYVWSKLGMYYIENHFDDETIMKNITSQVYPNSWSNEYSNVLKKRKNLFLEMKNNSNPIVSNIGKVKYDAILKQIDISLAHEKKENEERFNTFE